MTVMETVTERVSSALTQLRADRAVLVRTVLAAEAGEADAAAVTRSMRVVRRQTARLRRAIQPRYREYLISEAWRARADAAKDRVGHRCQVCYGTERLEAHHRTYKRLGHERPEDITVLCRDCHELYEAAKRRKRGVR